MEINQDFEEGQYNEGVSIDKKYPDDGNSVDNNGYMKAAPRFIGNNRSFQGGNSQQSSGASRINTPSFLKKMWNPNPDQGQSSNRQYNNRPPQTKRFFGNNTNPSGGSSGNPSYQKPYNNAGYQKRPRGYLDVDDPTNHSLQKEEIDKENSFTQNNTEIGGYGNEFNNNHEGKHKFQKRPWEDGGHKSSQMSYKKEAPPVLLEKLSEEEMLKLLENWRAQLFIPFNSWIQITKATVDFRISENQKAFDTKTPVAKSFICHAQIVFNSDSEKIHPSLAGSVQAMGLGKKKKEAKASATEKLVIEIYSRGLLEKGLRNKNFLLSKNPDEELGRTFSSNPSKQDEELQEKIAKRVKNLSKKMQLALKKDDFVEACTYLLKICEAQRPDWNEVR
jgi:hypothetical protein